MRPVSSSIGNKVSVGGTNSHNQFQPRSLNTFCPYCSSRAIFTLTSMNQSSPIQIWQTQSSCPSCEEKIYFTLHYDHGRNGIKPIDVSMFPSPTLALQAIDLPSSLPAILEHAIRDAEAAYRAGIFSSTVISAGRALEGLLKYLLQEPDKTLFELIDQFCKSDEVAQPISKLSHTMRKGRNAGAHFDENILPDQESAEIMIELLHYLISYLFLFGEKAEKLSTKLK